MIKPFQDNESECTDGQTEHFHVSRFKTPESLIGKYEVVLNT